MYLHEHKSNFHRPFLDRFDTDFIYCIIYRKNTCVKQKVQAERQLKASLGLPALYDHGSMSLLSLHSFDWLKEMK